MLTYQYDNLGRNIVKVVPARAGLSATNTRIRDVRLHDLRHTFASHAVMAKENLPMNGKLLSHALVASSARYAHFDDDHLLEATESIGTAIEKAMLTGSF